VAVVDKQPPPFPGSGRSSSVALWTTGGAVVVLAVLCALLIASLTEEHRALSAATRWLEDAEEYRYLVEKLSLEADRARREDRADFLARQLPPRVLEEARTRALLASAPISGEAARSGVGAWAQVAPVLNQGVVRLVEDETVSPGSLAEPAATVASALSEVLPVAAAQASERAERLGTARTWLLGFAILSLVAAAVLVVLHFRVRRSRDALSSALGSLRESEERYRQTFEQNGAAQLLVDPGDGRIVDANRAACELYGLGLEELRSEQVTRLALASPEEARRLAALLARRTPGHDVVQQLLPTGDAREVEAHVSPVSIRGRRLAYAILHDVTARRRAEAALRESQERLSVTLRWIADGVVGTGTFGAVELMNPAAEAVTGWTQAEAVGRAVDQVCPVVDERTRLPRSLTPGAAPRAASLVVKRRDGTERIVESTSAPILGPDGLDAGVVIALRDVTQQRAMEREAMRARNLESLGILAGGIAHDFNNFLAGMIGNIELARMDLPAETAVWGTLAKAESAARRAQGLARQLLAFARGGAPVRRVTSLGDLLKETTEFALRGSSVRSEVAIAPDLAPVDADEGQINQVVHNLLLNARQAMPGGGTIEVRASNVEIPPGHGTLAPGRYVHVSVADDGPGIPEDALSRLFTPYFTTKKEGTGLGLAISYGIVRKHDGLLSVESEIGRGTTFHVHLPASTAAPARGPELVATPKEVRGRVLVMDDDPAVLDLLTRMLDRLGYEADFVRDGEEAVRAHARARREERPYDVTILDLTVPGAPGGKDAVKRILAADPKAKVVVTSGYTDDPVMADYVRYGFKAALPKPFTRNDLSTVLRDARLGP
jgi:PAS domain S-box-containing protein